MLKSRSYHRLGWLTALVGILFVLGSSQFQVGAQARYVRGQVLSSGSAPFTETWQQMVQRDGRPASTRKGGKAAGKSLRRGLRLAPLHRAPDSRPGAPNLSGGVSGGFSGGEAAAAPTLFGGNTAALTAPQSFAANFPGVNLADQLNAGGGVIPPGTMGAIGPNHFLEVINDSVAVFTRTGLRLSYATLDSFFTIGGNAPAGGAVVPRVIYDRASGRFFVCVITIDDGVADNDILLAVSRSGDPTGTWDKYVIDAGTGTHFADYESMGMDDNGLYFGADMFPASGTNRFCRVIATPKAPLLATTPALGSTTAFDYSDMFRTPQPAHNQDRIGPAAPAFVVGSSDVALRNFHFRTIVWNGGTPAISPASFVLSSPAYDQTAGAPAQGAAVPVDDLDDRIQMAVIRNGSLWACRTVRVNSTGGANNADRDAAEWFEYDTAGGVLTEVQLGRVFDTAAANPRSYYYPSLMVNGQGHMSLGFSGSAANQFIGAYTTCRLATDPLGMTGAVTQIVPGGSAYNLGANLGYIPWGFYSYTSLDPNDDMTIWTIQEHASATADIWATRIAALRSEAPTLANPAASAIQGTFGAQISLTGTGIYDPGAGYPGRLQVQLLGGAVNGISNYNVVYNSPTSVSLTFDVAQNASPGPRNIVLTNPDGQTATVTAGFTVLLSPLNSLQFSAANYTIPEDAGVATITVTREGNPANPASINYSTSPGTASTPADFVSVSGTLNFAAGETTQSFDIPIVGDRLLEGNELLNISLSGATGTGAVLGATNTATLTIQDDLASPAPTNLTAAVASSTQIRLSWVDHADNEDGFQIERSTAGAPFVALATAPSGALMALDSNLTNGVTYTYRIRAFKGGVASAYSNTASAVITTLAFSLSNFTTLEKGNATVTVTRAGDNSSTATVAFSTAPGSASTLADYLPANGTLTFGANESSKTFTVPILADRLLEGNETVNLSLASVTGNNIFLGAQSTATLTIQDDTSTTAPASLQANVQSVSQVQLTWADNSLNEDGFQVERKLGDANAPDNYTTLPSVGANVTGTTDDTAVGGNTYTYRVRAFKGANTSDYSNLASATITVIQFAAPTFTVAENQVNAVVVVSRAGSPAGAASVTFTTSNGTATTPADYQAVSVVVNFMEGETTKPAVVPLVDDNILEGSETVNLALSGVVGTGIFLGSQNTAVLTITDDTALTAPGSLALTPQSASAIRLDWVDRSANEDGFQVERKEGTDGTYAQIGTTGTNTATFVDANVTPGVLYFYRVRAFQGSNLSSYSNEASITVTALNFNAANLTANERDGVANVTITRTGDATAGAAVRLTTVNGSATAPDDFVAVNTLVFFQPGAATVTTPITLRLDRLIEGNESVTLALSSPNGPGTVVGDLGTATLTIQDDGQNTAPSGLTATAVTGGNVRLNWTDNAQNETGFQIHRRAGTGMLAQVGTVGANTLTFTDTAVIPGVAYTYQVRAAAGNGTSDFSNEAAITVTVVQFQAATLTLPEAAGTATFTVTRTGDLSEAVTVNYSTSDGTATAPADYVRATGALTFAPGQGSATFTVFVLSDSELEGPETVNLALGTPAGSTAVVGTQGTAVLTITDDPSLPAPVNLTATVIGTNRVLLNWTDRSTTETDFIVERKLGAGAFTQVGFVVNDGTTFVDLTATSGTALTYRVRATNKGVESLNSNEATVTIETTGKAKVNPTKLNFGKVSLVGLKTKRITIRNNGTGTLSGNVPTLTGPFQVTSGAGPFALARGATRVVTVEFKPAAVGATSDVLAITTTDPAKAVVNVTLRGSGK